jgi:hypothetical protein
MLARRCHTGGALTDVAGDNANFPRDYVPLRLGQLAPSLSEVRRDERVLGDARGKVRCRRAKLGWQGDEEQLPDDVPYLLVDIEIAFVHAAMIAQTAVRAPLARG